MNERIRDLALDAIVKNAAADLWVFTDEELEKFVESIAKECMDICQKVTDSGMFDGNQQYASAYCRDAIKQHFGVK